MKNVFLFSITLLFIITFYQCSEESNPVDDSSVLQSTKNITAKDGGSLEPINNNGDKIILSIPKYALEETKSVTLQLLNETLTNPFSKSLINTIRILPDGLKLKHAAQLKVSFKEPIADTNRTILYCIKEQNFTCPLYKSEITSNSVTSELYHFSDYGGAQPANSEIVEQSDKLKTGSGINLLDWQSFSDMVGGMLQYIELLQMIGETEKAEELIQTLKQRIVEQVNAFLDLPISQEPCGYYQQALFKNAEFVIMMTSNEQLEQRVSDRCVEIRNRCWIRGEVEYDHDYTYSAEGGTIHRTIKGFVPYIVNTYNEPYGEISGSGTIDCLGIEQAASCTGTETGIGNVVLSGELEADEFGYPWLNFEMDETWADSLTVVCPNGTVTYPFNPPPSTETARFLMEDGNVVLQLVPGASEHVKWILQVNFQS